ncbi:MAG: hypothetical protein K9K32_05880 [Halanaerobiales bacterium]|nr:hypothetical protein [Halanaerobiales bacterium]
MAKVEVKRHDRSYQQIKQGDIFRIMPADNVLRMVRDLKGCLIAISMISGNREWKMYFDEWTVNEFIDWIKEKYSGIDKVYYYSNDDVKIVIKHQ